jgi:hypothetical protein
MRVTDQQFENLAATLQVTRRKVRPMDEGASMELLDVNENNLRDENAMQLHLTDDQYVSYILGTLEPNVRPQSEQHILSCTECADEIRRIRSVSTIWEHEIEIQRLENRIQSVFRNSDIRTPLETAWSNMVDSFKISLQPLLRPLGAYGEAVEEITSTVEFSILESGTPVDGLRGLLKRVNREYYVRISATDSEARRVYGNRAAMISISDDELDHPILQRKIDIGVTVLLGTDFRLTDKSFLAVEMLPSAS